MTGQVIDTLGIGLADEYYRGEDNNAKLVLVKNILSDMDLICDVRQLRNLTRCLDDILKNYSIAISENTEIIVDPEEVNDDLVNRFVETKKLKGLSDGSIKLYISTLEYLIKFFPDKTLSQLTTDDIREWFTYLLDEKGTSAITVDNYRRNLNSFYNFCTVEGLVLKNPIKKIKTIKRAYQVKQPFSELELVKLRDNIDNLRLRAIFELLISSGLRIGELVSLNKDSIDLKECSGYVVGKGDKERKFYFSIAAKYYIEQYLETRDDTYDALFVAGKNGRTLKGNRLGQNGIGRVLRDLGKNAGVPDVHPHRFRRTFATKLLQRDVSLEQIRVLLGHNQISTTKLYVVENEEEIEYNHKRFVN